MKRIWTQAKEIAAVTPESRNRYVDFLRAVSILAVITGHWLVVALLYRDGTLTSSELTAVQPGTQWLTWLFQVMPIFFIVGGYANAVSLQSANQRGTGYAGWLAGRLARLVTPLLILVLFWGGFSAILHFAGVSGPNLRLASRAALIPTWFLAIYIMVVVLAPLTYRAWQRWGFGSLFAFAAAGALSDLAFFAAELHWVGWGNYFWVWLSVHHLGYAWRDNRLGSPTQLLLLSAAGFLALATLIFEGPYPFAMVGSPDTDLSNTTPPKMTLLALGLGQFGLLLAIEAPMRKLLGRLRLWAATVLVNSLIMTVYLWHITVMVFVVAAAYLLGGIGLELQPGSSEWWLTRPVWIGVLYACLIPVALALAPLERLGRGGDRPPPSAARQIVGAVLLCLGIALLALYGFGDSPLPYLDIGAFLLVVVGAGINGLLPRPGAGSNA
jgi:surface polysaccharide O-acyltransferase-like enzyme